MITIPKEEIVNVTQLKLDNSNPNVMNKKAFEALKKNITKYGFIVPIITNKDYLIADGEHRLRAAKDLGMTEVRIIKLDVKEVDRKILRQVLNKLSGEHDKNLDLLEYKEIFELGGEEEFIELLALSNAEHSKILDSIRDVKEEETINISEHLRNINTSIKTGQVHKLGNHRLMCGDATNKANVSILMNNKKADMVFVDPPYNVNLEYKDYKDDKSTEEFLQMHELFQENLSKNLKPGGAVYFMTGDNYLSEVIDIFKKRFRYSQQLIWLKENPNLTHGDYQYNYESIIYGWNQGGTHKYYGPHVEPAAILFERDKGKKSVDHPAQRPLELIRRYVQNSTKKNETILDLFGGSGSTLIGCEQVNRTCYMMEIDPKYCQIIIDRWEKYTGKKAEKLT